MLSISMTLLRARNASGEGRHGWEPMNNANQYGGGDGGVCVCVVAHACSRVRWHACVRDVFAIYDNKILSRLIMIIIKIIHLRMDMS